MFKKTTERQECVVYSRVVGWMTPLRNWNKGKQAEWVDRVVYNIKKLVSPKEEEPTPAPEEKVEIINEVSVSDFNEPVEKPKFVMRPEVPGIVREEDVVKKDSEGNTVPSFL